MTLKEFLELYVPSFKIGVEAKKGETPKKCRDLNSVLAVIAFNDGELYYLHHSYKVQTLHLPSARISLKRGKIRVFPSGEWELDLQRFNSKTQKWELLEGEPYILKSGDILRYLKNDGQGIVYGIVLVLNKPERVRVVFK